MLDEFIFLLAIIKSCRCLAAVGTCYRICAATRFRAACGYPSFYIGTRRSLLADGLLCFCGCPSRSISRQHRYPTGRLVLSPVFDVACNCPSAHLSSASPIYRATQGRTTHSVPAHFPLRFVSFSLHLRTPRLCTTLVTNSGAFLDRYILTSHNHPCP